MKLEYDGSVYELRRLDIEEEDGKFKKISFSIKSNQLKIEQKLQDIDRNDPYIKVILFIEGIQIPLSLLLRSMTIAPRHISSSGRYTDVEAYIKEKN